MMLRHARGTEGAVTTRPIILTVRKGGGKMRAKETS